MAFTTKNIPAKTVFNKKVENIENSQHITCQVTKFYYQDEDSGFFVFAAVIPEGYPNAAGQVNGQDFATRKFAVVGTSLLMVQTVVEGQEVEVWGNFEPGKQPNTIQFSALAIQEKIPTKPKAIELFLGSGKLYGVGPKTAKKIVNKYGPNTIEMLDNNPDLLLEIDGINEKKLEIIKQSWKEWRGIYEIVATMRLYNVGDSDGVKIFNHFKDRAIKVIKESPYELTEVDGIGFTTADKIAQSIGMSPVDKQRIEKCILYTMEKIAEEGNTAFSKEGVAYKTNELLKIAPELIDDEIENLITKGELIPKIVHVKNFKSKYSDEFTMAEAMGIASKKIHNTEVRIAKELKRIMEYPLLEEENSTKENLNNFLTENPGKLDKSQLEAADLILSNKVSILTGGPGTGKTHTIKSLLNYFDGAEKSLGASKSYDVVLCAPTGRAAKRIEELTGRKGSTIHRLLGFKEGKFVHNENNRLSGDVFIVDETSMVDIWLANAFLKALPSNARVIFVGDKDQLESVGAGNFLFDLMESEKIPTARLREPHRQALNSNIIVAAYSINNKKMPELHALNSNSDFVFVEREGVTDIHDTILEIVSDLVSSGVDHEHIQILSPKKESEVGIKKLNETMRAILNPMYMNFQESKARFVPGDRVMQFKNNRELDIYNGDIGHVRSVDEEDGSMLVEFDNKEVELSAQDLSHINLSYATTIHKSQGSDYPYVIIPMSRSHQFMWDAKLLYTAVTRGKTKVILVGEKKTLFSSVAQFKQKNRITGLKDSIVDVFDEPVPEHHKSLQPF